MVKNISKKVIGILGIPNCDQENSAIITLYNDYKEAVFHKNCIPFMLCPLLNIDYFHTKINEIPEMTIKEKEIYKEMVDLCDGIIIPGGYKMYPFQEFIVNYAIEKDIPILGVCMGMQLLATLDNKGYCLEKNETQLDHRVTDKKYAHKVKIIENTMLYDILKQPIISVNSKHRYHVKCVNHFKISAYSEDGLIEAIELPDKKFVMGVQWHPETMIHYDENADKIFDHFVKKM